MKWTNNVMFFGKCHCGNLTIDGWCETCDWVWGGNVTNFNNERKTYEFIVKQVCSFTVQGDGRNELEAQQDAIERFHRLVKSGDLRADSVSKPNIVKTVTAVNRK